MTPTSDFAPARLQKRVTQAVSHNANPTFSTICPLYGSGFNDHCHAKPNEKPIGEA